MVRNLKKKSNVSQVTSLHRGEPPFPPDDESLFDSKINPFLLDVTIDDYANNTKKINSRISKIHSTRTKTNPQPEHHKPQLDDVDDPNNEEPEKEFRKRNKIETLIITDQHVYNEYHIDIWEAISRHIQPEDIQSFSRICKTTAFICQTASFWKQIYHRVYRESAELPVRLQPNCMVRIGGLRTCTIRSLFYMHPPLKDRLARGEQQSITDLRRRECISTWLVRVKDLWYYCFKFKQPLMSGSRLERSEKLRRKNVFEKVHRDIFQNPDEGCKLLVVKMSAMRPLPELFGHQSFLHDIKMSLSSGCVRHKLVMEFVGTGRETLANVVYDPVHEVRVLDWWTPAYHSYEANWGV